MDSIQKGNITELRVQLKLVELGFHVFTPITDGSPVDLIYIDKKGFPQRVQIKKSKATKTGFSFDARKSTSSSRVRKKRYTSDDIDCFATIFNSNLYIVPIELCEQRARILLRINEKYQNQSEPMYAKDYLYLESND